MWGVVGLRPPYSPVLAFDSFEDPVHRAGDVEEVDERVYGAFVVTKRRVISLVEHCLVRWVW